MSKLNRKRRNEEEEHVDESWLIPYADILTLLLALFIVLYAASSINTSKFNAIMGSFKTELTGEKGGDKSAEPKPANPPTPEVKNAPLDNLKQQINTYINDNSLQNVVSLQDTKRGIEVSLKDLILFDSGKADLKENAYPTLDKLIGLANTVPNSITIEGYTDNEPIHSSSFASNWELSAARAASVLHYFEAHQIKPERLQFTGLGEYHPLYPNDTPEHRQSNRRVTITVLREN